MNDDALAALMSDFDSTPIKFFPSDVIKGKARKVGDVFAASFVSGVTKFQVTEHYGDFFFAEKV